MHTTRLSAVRALFGAALFLFAALFFLFPALAEGDTSLFLHAADARRWMRKAPLTPEMRATVTNDSPRSREALLQDFMASAIAEAHAHGRSAGFTKRHSLRLLRGRGAGCARGRGGRVHRSCGAQNAPRQRRKLRNRAFLCGGYPRRRPALRLFPAERRKWGGAHVRVGAVLSHAGRLRKRRMGRRPLYRGRRVFLFPLRRL